MNLYICGTQSFSPLWYGGLLVVMASPKEPWQVVQEALQACEIEDDFFDLSLS